MVIFILLFLCRFVFFLYYLLFFFLVNGCDYYGLLCGFWVVYEVYGEWVEGVGRVFCGLGLDSVVYEWFFYWGVLLGNVFL